MAGATISQRPSRSRSAAADSARLRSLDAGEEAVDLCREALGTLRELTGSAEHLSGGAAGRGRGLLHADDVAGDFLRPLRRLLDVAGDLLRRRALLLDGRRDAGGNLADLADRAPDRMDRGDGVPRRVLHLPDLSGDLFGRLGGLAREALHLRGDDGETLAGVARPSRLDRRVEGEEIRLV